MELTRFTKTERLLHWSFAVPVILLAATGAVMIAVSFAGEGFSLSKLSIVTLHIIPGFFLVIMPAVVFILGDRKIILGNVKEVLSVSKTDRAWLKASLRNIFRRKAGLPDCGKFNAGQKLNTVLTMFLVMLLSLSGFSMLLIKGSLLSNIIHAALTFVFLCSFTGHLYLALINPSTRHAFHAITTGMVNADWLREHHGQMYREYEKVAYEKIRSEGAMDKEGLMQLYGKYYNSDLLLKKDKYFVTGATGFLGSHIVRHLLDQGKKVLCLVRGGNEAEAMERLQGVLRLVPPQAAEINEGLQVVCGNITQPGLGIRDMQKLQGIKYFIHCAADINFREKKADASYRTNVTGSIEAIRLARRCSIPYFLHISTAYVSGKKEGLITESLNDGQAAFNNVYESTKAEAEVMLARFAGEHKMNLSILRPSIIVGDSVNGYIPKFNTIYDFLVPLVRIRKSVDRGGLKDGRIKATKNGPLNVSVMLPGHEETRVNLVPVDFVVKAASDIAESEKNGIHIYHIVDDNPSSMRDVIRYVSAILNMTGIRLTSPEYYRKTAKSGLDALLVHLNRTYMGYTTSGAVYDTSNLRQVFSGAFPFPDKRELFKLMIEFTRGRASGVMPQKSIGRYKDIETYFEVFLKNKRGRKLIHNLESLTSCFEIAFSDIPDRHWSVGIEKGVLVSVSDNGHNGRPVCRYVVSSGAFRDITRGSLSPQECFFRGEIDIQGDMKQGLKLASLMEVFFREHPYRASEKEMERVKRPA